MIQLNEGLQIAKLLMTQETPEDGPEPFVIPDDVLTDKEAMHAFMEIYLVKLENTKANLLKIDETKLKMQKSLAFYEEKYELLAKYNIFLESKGFGLVKQTVDEHADEIRKSQEPRIQDVTQDMMDFFCDKTADCCLPKFHVGDCATPYNVKH